MVADVMIRVELNLGSELLLLAVKCRLGGRQSP